MNVHLPSFRQSVGLISVIFMLPGTTCDDGCDDVYNALVSGSDTDVEVQYYTTAYTDAKRLLQNEIPEDFWTWMDENEAAREAILSVTWPVDPEV